MISLIPSRFITFGTSMIGLLLSSLNYLWISTPRTYFLFLVGLSLLSSFFDVFFIYLYSFVSDLVSYTLLFVFIYLFAKIFLINTLNKHIASGLFSVSSHFTPVISRGLVNSSLLSDYSVDQVNRFIVALNGIYPAECLTLVISSLTDLPALVLQFLLILYLISPYLVISYSLIIKVFLVLLLIVLFFLSCYLLLRTSSGSARTSSNSLSSIFLYQRVLRSSKSEVLTYSLLQHTIHNLRRLSHQLLIANTDLHRGSQLSAVFLQAISFMPLIFSISLLGFASIEPLILLIVTLQMS